MAISGAEADRRIGNVVQVGVIKTVDLSAATARVEIGDLLTPPIPWATLSAGPVQFWWAPSAGSQVIVLAPSGDMAQAMILFELFKGNAPSSEATNPVFALNGGKIIVDGNIEVTGDVIASGVSLVHHVHIGVASGPAKTGEPDK